MGFNLVKAVSRAVGLPDKIGKIIVSAVAPPLALTDLAVNAIGSGVAALSHPHQSAALGPETQQYNISLPGQGYNPYPQYSVVPTGFSDYQPISTGAQFADFSGSGFNDQGVMPWDYSMASQTFSQAPTPVYPRFSEPTQGSFLDSLTNFLPVAALFL